jgi:hypothetical protein
MTGAAGDRAATRVPACVWTDVCGSCTRRRTLCQGAEELIIVEGEIDKLAVEEALWQMQGAADGDRSASGDGDSSSATSAAQPRADGAAGGAGPAWLSSPAGGRRAVLSVPSGAPGGTTAGVSSLERKFKFVSVVQGSVSISASARCCARDRLCAGRGCVLQPRSPAPPLLPPPPRARAASLSGAAPQVNDCSDLLTSAQRIILAVDADGPGVVLAGELARRCVACVALCCTLRSQRPCAVHTRPCAPAICSSATAH